MAKTKATKTDETIMEEAKETDAILTGEKEVTTDTELNEVIEDDSEFDSLGIKNEEETQKEFEEKEEETVVHQISQKMINLFNDAIYNHSVMTGRLTGVKNTRLGAVAIITYNGEGSTEGESVTVYISSQNMGLDNAAIKQSIIRRSKNTKTTLTDEQMQLQISRVQEVLLTRMLNAKISFIPTEILADQGIVVGDREKAMERMRRNFYGNEKSSIPRITKMSSGLARIIRVTYRYLVVEFSGYEVRLSPRQITPLAVNLIKDYHVGDDIRVTLMDIDEENNRILLRGSAGLRVDIAKKVNEYSRSERVVGTVYYKNPATGTYYLRLSNGVMGIANYNRSVLRVAPKIDDNVVCIIQNKTPDNSAVRVRMRSVISNNN